jgi:hypothetical protein
MASGDLLRQLFRGYAKRDDTTFRAAAEAIIPFALPSEQDRILLLRLFLRGFDCTQLNLSTLAHNRHFLVIQLTITLMRR